MNKLEIFQEVYGKDYAFTETELSRLLKVTELIVRECINIVDYHPIDQEDMLYKWRIIPYMVDVQEKMQLHFGVER